MNPLAVEIWLSMLAAYVMVSLTIWIVARFSPYEWVEPTPCPSCKCPLQVGSRQVVLIDRAIEFLNTVKRCRELDRHESLQSSFFFLNYLRNVIFKFVKIKQRNREAKIVPNFLQMFAIISLKINRCRDKGIENV